MPRAQLVAARRGLGTARRGSARRSSARARHGTAQHGTAGTAQHGTARHGAARHGAARHGSARRSTARLGTGARHGTARHGARRSSPRRPGHPIKGPPSVSGVVAGGSHEPARLRPHPIMRLGTVTIRFRAVSAPIHMIGNAHRPLPGPADSPRTQTHDRAHPPPAPRTSRQPAHPDSTMGAAAIRLRTVRAPDRLIGCDGSPSIGCDHQPSQAMATQGAVAWGRRRGPTPHGAAAWGRRMGPPHGAAAWGRRMGAAAWGVDGDTVEGCGSGEQGVHLAEGELGIRGR